MAIGTTTRILHVSTLRTGGAHFNWKLHHAVAAEAKNGQGDGSSTANILVHPLSCRLTYRRPESIFDNPPHGYKSYRAAFHCQQQNPYYHYNRYITRLESHLRETHFPVFVFTAEEHCTIIEEWLSNLSLISTAVIVNTNMADPTPTANQLSPCDIDKTWEAFTEIMVALGINTFALSGEIHYSVAGSYSGEQVHIDAGCVGGAQESLFKGMPHSKQIGIYKDLTYPGFIFSSPNLVEHLLELSSLL